MRKVCANVEYRCKLCADKGTTLIWKDWRVCTGNTKKERFKEHTTYKDTLQLSIGYTLRIKEVVYKRKRMIANMRFIRTWFFLSMSWRLVWLKSWHWGSQPNCWTTWETRSLYYSILEMPGRSGDPCKCRYNWAQADVHSNALVAFTGWRVELVEWMSCFCRASPRSHRLTSQCDFPDLDCRLVCWKLERL